MKLRAKELQKIGDRLFSGKQEVDVLHQEIALFDLGAFGHDSQDGHPGRVLRFHQRTHFVEAGRPDFSPLNYFENEIVGGHRVKNRIGGPSAAGLRSPPPIAPPNHCK